MPDLRPDMSVFTKPSQMGIGELLGTAMKMQEFQGKQGVSDLLKQNVDPVTLDPDFGAVSAKLPTVQGIVTPDMVAGIENARQSQLATRTQEMQGLARVMGPIADRPGELSEDDIQDARTRLAGVYGGGKRGQMIADRVLGVGTKNEVRTGAAFKQRMTEIQAGYGQLPETVEVKDSTGATRLVPKGAVIGAERGGTGAPSQGGGGGGGGYRVGLPTGATAPMESAAKAATNLTEYVASGGPEGLSQQRAMLRELDALSPKAGEGPSTPYEKTLNEFAQRIGLKGITYSKEQLAATEQYAKIASTLAGQMGTSLGTGSGEWLHNAQASNPNEIMSRMGREGIHHWLMGNLDSIDAIHQKWRQWVGAHPNMEGQFYNWINGQVPDANFNIHNFDPRVFQYQAMTPSERKAFRKMMSSDDEKLLQSNHDSYVKQGLIGK